MTKQCTLGILCGSLFTALIALSSNAEAAVWTRRLAETSITGSTGPNATVVVSKITPAQSGNPCALKLSSLPDDSIAESPLVVQVQQNQTSFLNLTALNYFINSTNATASNSAILSSGALAAPFNPQLGLTNITFAAANASVGTTATLLGGLFQAVSGSIPLQLDPSASAPICNLNFTFVVVNASSGTTSSSSSSTSSSSSSSSSSNINNSQTTFSTSTGTTTPLPAGIPVTTNNLDGSNRGFGNTGSNNLGNGNKGNCNQGDGNVGDNNKGEGNRGSCNIGNIGNGWTGSGIVNTAQDGPNYPCTCQLNAVSASAG